MTSFLMVLMRCFAPESGELYDKIMPHFCARGCLSYNMHVLGCFFGIQPSEKLVIQGERDGWSYQVEV
jgi:hypothetical protein